MVQLQLYIEGQEVEMFKDESFTLTQSIQDIRDISKIFTDFTKTFNVPASKNNNKIFKHFYNFNILGFDARKKKESTLLMNYKPFKEGKIKLEGVQLKNNEPETYKLTFYGNLVNLKDVLGEDLLSGLVNLEYFNFEYTDTNIKEYLSTGKDVDFFGETIDKGLVFPLITVRSRLIYDTSAGNTDKIKNVNYLGSNVNKGLPLNELKPALRLYSIIKAIEVQYAELEFDRSFFSTTNTAFYGLYLWLHNKEGALFQDQEAQYPISNLTPIEINSSIGGFKGASFTNRYNEQDSKRELRIFVDPNANGPYSLVIKKDGEQFQKFENLSGNTINGQRSDKGNIELPAGIYTFYIETITVSTYTVDIRITDNPNSILRGKKTVLYRGNVEYGISNNKTVNVPSIMPDMKVIDFLTGIFKMFNLTAFQNKNKIIEVKTLDTFFESSNKVWDITKDLNKSKSTVDTTLPFKEIDFSYSQTGSFLANNHKELAGKDWGSLAYKDGEKFEGKNYSIELPFEHMKFERLYGTTAGVINTATDSDGNIINLDSYVQYGYSVGESQNPYLTKPLIFYAPQTLVNISVRSLDDTTISTVQNPFTPMNSQFPILLDFSGQSINFNSEIDEWSRLPNEQSLFKVYYEKYVKDMMDVRKRISTFKAFLPMKMLYNLSLADKIIVFDDIYRINKLTTDFSTNESTVELTNIFDEIKFNTLLSVAGIGITIDFDTILASTIDFQASQGNAQSGFSIPGITTAIPSDIPSNNPQPILEDEIIVVTPPKIQSVPIEENIDTEVYMKYQITELGKLINTPQIDEYGFLYSTDEDKLLSDDLAILKSTTGVINIPFKTTSSSKYVLPAIASSILTGLAHPASIYFKFYGSTNTNSLFPEANNLSPVVETKTIASSSTIYGTLAVSTWSQYQATPASGCGTQFTLNLGSQFMFEHTGGARNIQVGDIIRTTGVMQNGRDNQTWDNATFDGGVKSLFGMSWPNYANYMNAYILDSNGYGRQSIRVHMWTGVAEVVNTCP
tara:strand:+ start:28738 stop:31788 length:3051 start_codon:yes stop_codon:yes gene_type:complete